MSDAATGTAAEEERPAGFLGLMRNRNYALLWSGQLVSELGNRFHWVAVSLWVYSKTGSASAVSLAISSMFVGGLFVSLWAGVLVDRFNRKTIMIVADLARVVLVAAIPPLMGMNIWLVYADLMLISVATAFFRPAIFAVVPRVVSRRDLLPANAFFSAMDTGTEIIGPVLAGVLAQFYGYSLLLYVDAATYAVSALCIVGMAIVLATTRVEVPLRLRNVWNDMLDGLRYIRRDSVQWGLFVLLFPAALVGGGLNALQTPLAKGVVGVTDAEFGTYQGVWGIGFVIASLLLGWYGARLKRSLLIMGGYLAVSTATALMGLSNSYEQLLLTAFIVGFANTLHYVSVTTVLMERSPQDVIGRVISTRQAALSAVRVVSPIVFGGLAEVVGIRQAIVLMAAVGAAGTSAVAIALPIVRKFDAAEVGPPGPQRSVWAILSGPIDPAFGLQEQRRLNLISLAIVAIAWLLLLVRAPVFALGLLLVVLGIAYVGALFRGSGLLP